MVKKFFMGAMTGDGFVHFFGDIADMYNLEKLFILKGGSGTGKSTFIKRFTELFNGHDIDLFYCSSDPKSLDGAVITDLKIGIIDGTPPHSVEYKYPGMCEEIIDLAHFIDSDALLKKGITREQINVKIAGKKHEYKSAVEHLSAAASIHNELENLYSGCVDFKRMDAFFNKKFQMYIEKT